MSRCRWASGRGHEGLVARAVGGVEGGRARDRQGPGPCRLLPPVRRPSRAGGRRAALGRGSVVSSASGGIELAGAGAFGRRSLVRSPETVLTHILGISCFFHDSAAALLRDGMLVAA